MWKQKLNTKSSTEVEIVRVSEYLVNMIWAQFFLEAQGFIVTKDILHQDKQSVVRIRCNGKYSSCQKTNYFSSRLFWIKDRLKSEVTKVKYCPIKKIIADFFTKLLQGTLFRRFCDIVLGHKHITSLDFMIGNSSLKERIGSQICEKSDLRTVNSLPITNFLSEFCGKEGTCNELHQLWIHFDL